MIRFRFVYRARRPRVTGRGAVALALLAVSLLFFACAGIAGSH